MASQISLEDIAILIKEIQKDVRKNNDEFKLYREQLNEAKNRIDNLERNQVDIIKQLNDNGSLFKRLTNTYGRNNLVIFNIKETSNETTAELLQIVLQLFSSKLNINIEARDIDNIFRMGRVKGMRPILLKLQSFLQKLEILKVSKKLKGTNIVISNDFSEEVRKIRKKLIPFLMKARDEKHLAYLRNDKLVINGKMFSLENCLKGLPTISSSRDGAEVVKDDNEEENDTNSTLNPRSGGLKQSSPDKARKLRTKKRKMLPKGSPPLRKFNSIESFIKRYEMKCEETVGSTKAGGDTA